MPIFGTSLLKMAQRLIPPETVTYSAWLSNVELSTGVIAPVYDDPVPIQGNVQAVPRSMYETFALDLQKNYIVIYSLTPIRDLDRDDGTDLIDYAGRRYNVESNTDWQAQDGWQGTICVDVGPTP